MGNRENTLNNALLKRGRAGAYSFMYSTLIHLHEGDGDSWAINLVGDIAEMHRAEKGMGNRFRKVWSLELQSEEAPDMSRIDWDAVLERAVYAYDMNDPVISKFKWPLKGGMKERTA